MLANKIDDLIAEYNRRKAKLDSEWQNRKRSRTQQDAFTLFVKCILSSQTKWKRVVREVDQLQKNGKLDVGSADDFVDSVRSIGGLVKYEDRAQWIEDDREVFPVVFKFIRSIQIGEIHLSENGFGPKEIFEELDPQKPKTILQGIGVTQEGLRSVVKNLKGVGDKQASHFLSSLGFEGYAIIDTQILDKLIEFGIIEERPDNLTSSRYHAIEELMKQWCNKIGIPMHLLDMLWWKG